MASSQIFWNLANVDDESTMTFQIKDTDVAYVNTLRRMILTGVESLAFNAKMSDTGTTTDVKIITNTTPMTNEMLADRIGLIPITVPSDAWEKDEFEFRLSMENNTNTSMPVKAEHIEVFRMGRAEEGFVKYGPGNKEFFRPDPITGDTCLLAVLKAKQPNQAAQKIEFTARASIGTGQDHIRWSPVSQCSYAYTIDTDAARQQQFFQRWLENTKKMSLESLNDEPGKKEMMIREFQTMEVQRCYKINEKGEANSFDFIIENIGTLPISTIVERALINIEKKCAKYAGELPNDVRVVPADARMKGFDFYFPEEDHTLGNLFQAYMEGNMMNTGEVSYAGYKVPHPLRAEMVLRVGVDFPMDKARDGKQTVARAAISRAAAGCSLLFRQWREDWLVAQTRPIGLRNRESLRLNVGNAKALEEAAARVVVAPKAAAPGAKRVPQKSAFYGKLEAKAAAAYAPASPAYAPASPAYAPGTPNYGAVEEVQPLTRNEIARIFGPGRATPPYSPPTSEEAAAEVAARREYDRGMLSAKLPQGWIIQNDPEDGGFKYWHLARGIVQKEFPTA